MLEKRRKNYPIEIYVFWIVSFLGSFELIGGLLYLFLHDWGQLSQLQIQTLQSWFMFMILLMEIPTGLIGDIRGRKFSVIAGNVFLIVGPVVYGLFPNFKLFLLSEALFAIGAAFLSGAMEALLFDTVKEKGLEDDYVKINSINRVLMTVGRLVAAPVGGMLLLIMPVNRIFQLWALNALISLILIAFFIKEPEIISKREYVPNYREIFAKSMQTLRENVKLRKLVVYMTGIGVGGYFVLWLSPNLLVSASIPDSQLGAYRTILLAGEIVLGYFLAQLLDKSENGKYILVVCGIVFGVTYILSGLTNEIWAVVLFLLIGSFGLEHRGILSKYVNQHIESEDRATTLSFISMFRRVILALFNPVVGLAVDYSLKYTLIVLGVIMILITVFLTPRIKHA